MKVSVIIPNYRHALYLKERIDSVLEQTYRDFEVIILDDCSPDDSREIIETYRTREKIAHIVYNDATAGLHSCNGKRVLTFHKANIYG